MPGLPTALKNQRKTGLLHEMRLSMHERRRAAMQAHLEPLSIWNGLLEQAEDRPHQTNIAPYLLFAQSAKHELGSPNSCDAFARSPEAKDVWRQP